MDQQNARSVGVLTANVDQLLHLQMKRSVFLLALMVGRAGFVVGLCHRDLQCQVSTRDHADGFLIVVPRPKPWVMLASQLRCPLSILPRSRYRVY